MRNKDADIVGSRSLAMASKALLLLFFRAALSAAAATYRIASLAERRALSLGLTVEAAASDARCLIGGRSASAAALPTHGTAAVAPPHAMDAPSPRNSAPSSEDLSKPGSRVEFVPKKEDLVSDEALWNLYERWRKTFNQKREPDEMAGRFKRFKNRVLHVHRINNANANQSSKLGLTKFSDGKLADCTFAQKFPNVGLHMRGDGKILKHVFADFEVVNGKLFVYFPLEKGEGASRRKELSVDYEVVKGKLVADLPMGHELVAINEDFIRCRWIPYLP